YGDRGPPPAPRAQRHRGTHPSAEAGSLRTGARGGSVVIWGHGCLLTEWQVVVISGEPTRLAPPPEVSGDPAVQAEAGGHLQGAGRGPAAGFRAVVLITP